MNERQAQRLAMEIEAEGWNTETRHNSWTGLWTVRVWRGDTEMDQEEAYSVHYYSEWQKLRWALAEEQKPFTERDWSQYPSPPVKDDLPF
jgi:hypothetical protein